MKHTDFLTSFISSSPKELNVETSTTTSPKSLRDHLILFQLSLSLS